MSIIQVIGIDLGKSSFHLVGLDDQKQISFKKQLSRAKLLPFLANTPPCLIAFEACGGAHWLGRFCQQHGHKVILIPPQYVKPFVKGNKNDFNDALAKGHKVAKGLFAWLSQQPIRLSPMVIGELQALHDHYVYLTEVSGHHLVCSGRCCCCHC